MAYFPMFVDLEGQLCLIAGGGRVALRKAEKMLEFGARVKVIAPEILPEICRMGEVETIFRPFQAEDLDDRPDENPDTAGRPAALVIAATDDPEENHRIAELCRDRRIPVNAVDQIQDCSFIFPSILREGDLTAAFSSGGKSPLMTQMLKKQEQQILTPYLGQVNDLLGSCRNLVKGRFETEKERKRAYQTILDRCLTENTLPDETEIEVILSALKGIPSE